MKSKSIIKSFGLGGILFFGAAVLAVPARADAVSPPGAEKPPVQIQAPGIPRPESWAVPITDRIGLPNLFKINEVLYRGAQPKHKGFAQLKAMGIRTVVDLRLLHSERERAEKIGLRYVRLPEITWDEKNQDVIDFLRVVNDPGNQPVFVHCHHGSDRTGAMIAAYRVVVQGWSREEAIREMTEGGYGFHPMWKTLVKFIQDLDVEKIRKSIETKK
ncbi:MAG: tyrosine-protein phosphatase [bacterium]|nr:tyrosine-protein phosphatase [bacterium]